MYIVGSYSGTISSLHFSNILFYLTLLHYLAPITHSPLNLAHIHSLPVLALISLSY